MNKGSKLITMILATLLLCIPMVACSDSGKGSESIADNSNKPSFYGYEIDEGTDYGNIVIKVLTTAVSDTASCYQIKPESNPFYSEETTTATLTAAAECTKLVEELLGVEVEEEVIFTSSRFGGEMYQRISRDAMSLTADYLFCMPCLNEASMLATDGVLYDLNDVVDLKNEWWCQPFNDAVTIAGECYFATGDIGTVSKESTMFVAFNKRMESANGLAEKYGYSSLYEMVDKKAWTQDVMFEMSKSVYQDLNQNNICDPGDINGVSGQENIVYWLLRSGGINICTLNSDGYPELTVNNERAISLITNAQEYVQDTTAGFIAADDFMEEGLAVNRATQEFIDGRCLFFFNSLGGLNTIRSMEDDFGVLPCPLYDSTQEQYSNNVGSWTSNCVCIPTSIDPDQLELVGHFLEALGAVSRAKLTPAYYEQTLQYQISRDEDSIRMLDIITENRAPELAEMYRWGGMMAKVASMRKEPVGTFVSAYQSIETLTKEEIQETVEIFKSNNN